MFKQSYISYLQTQLNGLTPEGYSIKVIEEYGFGSSGGLGEKFKIYCYVKFGVGSKQTNTTDRINQPVIFTIKSEGGDFRTAKEIFDNFFLTYSRTVSQLEIDGESYNLWHNYNTPVVQSGVEQVGIHQRMTIIMTGVVSYSLEKIIGVKYKAALEIPPNGEPIFHDVAVINPQTQYNTQVITPQYLNKNFGYAEIEGANNSISFQMLLDKSDLAKMLLETSIYGTPLKIIMMIEYTTELSYTFYARVTSVANTHDTPSGDNILTVTCMPIGTF